MSDPYSEEANLPSLDAPSSKGGNNLVISPLMTVCNIAPSITAPTHLDGFSGYSGDYDGGAGAPDRDTNGLSFPSRGFTRAPYPSPNENTEDDESDRTSMTHDSELSLDYRFCDYPESSTAASDPEDTEDTDDSGYEADTPFDSGEDSEDDSDDYVDDERLYVSDASNSSHDSDDYSFSYNTEDESDSEILDGPVYRHETNGGDLECLLGVFLFVCLALITYGVVEVVVKAAWGLLSDVWSVVTWVWNVSF
ncbi:hypothetical protein F5Y18DRAFT_428727 [Xylariaceae sp. FL1019]|nr:hypothetical protein F5Y18DRAFT_428727 [Xylariaceae sp. FL1019]